ncbi:hypothetical protein Avbf_04921 [Armadillidium vulgare]|nr:hypothetical protein Avbf_04921 [Armadillidium vulgare]
MMTFMGVYGSKNHYVHLPEFKTSNFEDNEDTRPLPVVDPFTHSLFAPIIKRDRKKDKKSNRSFLRKFRTSLSKLNPSLYSQLNADMIKTSSNVYNNEKTFSRPLIHSENPIYTPQPNMPNFPANAVIINANTIKIGDNLFSRVFDNNKPTQMFRPANSSLNPGFAHQPRISRITMCTPNVVSSNNVPISTSRFIYTASPSAGMPRLIPVIQSQRPMNGPIPILSTMSNSQYSTIPPPGNNVSLNSGLTNISDPLHINFGDSPALRPMHYVPLNTHNHTGPGLTNGTNSSTYPVIQNGKFQNPEVMPCHISPPNLQGITVNNNLNVGTTVSNNNNNSSSIGGPPSHNFCVPGIINHGTTSAAAANFPSKPQHHDVNTSMTLSDKVSNLGNTSDDIRKSVIVNHHVVNRTLPLSSQSSSNINHHPVNPTLHSSSQSSAYVVNHSAVSPPLPLSSQPLANASSQTDEAMKNQCESVTFFQWLHELKNIGTRCGSGCSFGSKTIFFNAYAKYVKALISSGFPNTFTAATNAVYQLLIAVNSYCSYHAQLVMNDPDYLKNLRTLCNISDEGRNFGKFFGLHLPYISPLISNPVYSSSFNLFILKRFVFIVEKNSRIVLCPLPAACKFQDSDIFDKITILILMSPKFGLGPGLVIFPHSILGSNLLLSLGLKGPLFETWTISAHPKGGLTQSMMTEFLNGPCLSWIQSKKTYEDTYLAVDWWLSLDDQLIDNLYSAFHYIRLHKMFPLGKDPFDICISVYMERIWGLIVKMWSSLHNDVKLKEHCFPQFIYEVFNRLCDPKRLVSWCEESGLYPHNPNVTESFISRISNMYE